MRKGSSLRPCGRSIWRSRAPWGVIAFFALTALAACSSQPTSPETIDAQRAVAKQSSKDELNAKLASVAVKAAASDQALRTEYSLGPGDVLDISVFGVDELNRTVRVSEDGMIMLPLVGALKAGGKSVRDVENLLAAKLKKFMHQPDVSVFVSEYHSHQVSVTGAVKNPTMETLSRPRTVLEVLSKAGGLTSKAGGQIYVQTTVDGEPYRFIIDLNEVLSNPDDKNLSILLSGGDSIYVPEAGVVFVEGAVNKPGAYDLKGDTGVIEAIAMAGSTTFDARKADVQVIRASKDGKSKSGKEVVDVDLDKLKANESPNLTLRDGDIVVVPSNAFKRNFAGFWRGFKGIFGFGFSLNGP